MSFYSGKVASIGDGTNFLTADDWTLDFQMDAVDVTNFTSTGFQENIAGVAKCAVGASGPYNGQVRNVAIVGAVTTFAIAVGGGGPSFTVPARITRLSIKTGVRGAAEFDIQAESTGAFSLTY